MSVSSFLHSWFNCIVRVNLEEHPWDKLFFIHWPLFFAHTKLMWQKKLSSSYYWKTSKLCFSLHISYSWLSFPNPSDINLLITTMLLNLSKSIHPSIHRLSESVSSEHQSKQSCPNSFSSATSYSTSGRILSHSQASWEIEPLQKVLGLPQGLLLVGHAWSTSAGRRPRGIINRCSPHLSWLLLMSRGQRLYREPLPYDQPPFLFSEWQPRHPVEETNFGCLYLWSCSFAHCSQLMAIGEFRNEDKKIDNRFAFWLFSVFTMTNRYSICITADAAPICRSISDSIPP